MASFGAYDMSDITVYILAKVLTWMWVIGVAGCVIVIPWSAIKMFAVLFEKDAEEPR
ncbi:MAG TPA: hypothetical protein VH437_20390 [Terriglobales bacterium]